MVAPSVIVNVSGMLTAEGKICPDFLTHHGFQA